MNLNDILQIDKEPFENVDEDIYSYAHNHNKKVVLYKIHILYFNLLCKKLKADCIVPEISVWISIGCQDIWKKRELMFKNVIEYAGWHYEEKESRMLSKKDKKIFSKVSVLKDASKEYLNCFYIFKSRRLSAYLHYKEKSNNVKNMFEKGDQAIMETLAVIGNPFPSIDIVPYIGIERGYYIVVFYTYSNIKFYKQLNRNFEINILILDRLLNVAYELFGLKEDCDDIMGEH